MPFKIPALQNTFKIELEAGLPLASVERWGNIPYALCCPLCGCLHELPKNAQNGQEYTPICTIKGTHPHVYAAWLKSHPGAGEHTAIRLHIRGGQVIPLGADNADESSGLGVAA